MEEKQIEIINKIDNLDEIKRYKELGKIIKDNEEYKIIMDIFNKNKELYEKENRLNEEIINLRKKLFSIPEVKEYAKLESDIRLLVKQINKTICSIVEKEKCM